MKIEPTTIAAVAHLFAEHHAYASVGRMIEGKRWRSGRQAYRYVGITP